MSNPEYHIAFSRHVSLVSSNLRQFFSFDFHRFVTFEDRWFGECPVILVCIIFLLDWGYRLWGIPSSHHIMLGGTCYLHNLSVIM